MKIVEKVVMYKISRRREGGSKNPSLGRTQKSLITGGILQFQTFKSVYTVLTLESIRHTIHYTYIYLSINIYIQ